MAWVDCWSPPPPSREIGILPIFLFSDVRPHGGGTAVIRGSHRTVAELVWNKAGTTGLTGALLPFFLILFTKRMRSIFVQPAETRPGGLYCSRNLYPLPHRARDSGTISNQVHAVLAVRVVSLRWGDFLSTRESVGAGAGAKGCSLMRMVVFSRVQLEFPPFLFLDE